MILVFTIIAACLMMLSTAVLGQNSAPANPQRHPGLERRWTVRPVEVRGV